jgi:hypothetical protein
VRPAAGGIESALTAFRPGRVLGRAGRAARRSLAVLAQPLPALDGPELDPLTRVLDVELELLLDPLGHLAMAGWLARTAAGAGDPTAPGPGAGGGAAGATTGRALSEEPARTAPSAGPTGGTGWQGPAEAPAPGRPAGRAGRPTVAGGAGAPASSSPSRSRVGPGAPYAGGARHGGSPSPAGGHGSPVPAQPSGAAAVPFPRRRKAAREGDAGRGPGRAGRGPGRAVPPGHRLPGAAPTTLAAVVARHQTGAAPADLAPAWGPHPQGRSEPAPMTAHPRRRTGRVVVRLPRRREGAPDGTDPADPDALARLEARSVQKLAGWTQGAGVATGAGRPGVDATTRRKARSSTTNVRPPAWAGGKAPGAATHRPPGPHVTPAPLAVTDPAAYTPEAGEGQELPRAVRLLEVAVDRLEGIERRLAETRAEPGPPGPVDDVRWLTDEELADRLQHIFKGQARRRGIDLS